MKKWFFIMTVAVSLFASCSSEEKDGEEDVMYPFTTSEVTEYFKSYFYDKSGNVTCNKLEGFSATEWAIGSRDGVRPLEVFKDITGMDVSATQSYNYRFVSSDGQSIISITGNINAGDNAEYATMKVSIPSCPEIQTIHVGSEEYFNGTDSESVGVIFL